MKHWSTDGRASGDTADITGRNWPNADIEPQAAARARQHKPTTVEGMRAAARELSRSSLGDHDIAKILGLAVEQVRRLIGCGDCQ